MKKLNLFLLILASRSLECNFFNDAWDTVKDVSEKVAHTVEDKAKDIANDIKNAGEDLGNLFKSCGEVVALGTAYGSATAALKTAEISVKGTEVVGKKAALESANLALEGALQASKGTLDLANAIAAGLEKGFNIECFRFLGKITELEFELQAKLLGKSVNIHQKVDFKDAESLALKIFNELKSVIK